MPSDQLNFSAPEPLSGGGDKAFPSLVAATRDNIQSRTNKYTVFGLSLAETRNWPLGHRVYILKRGEDGS